MKRILLVGAGHAHAAVLAAFATESLYGASVTLVSPRARQVYSAMLPGVIAGHYAREAAEFDAAELARRASAEFVEGQVVKLDLAGRAAQLSDGRRIEYDVLGLNAGSRVDDSVPGSATHAVPAKPFEELLDRLRRAAHVAICGAGAAGAELAMALKARGGEVTLYSEADPFPASLSRRVERALRRRGVDFRPGMRVDAVEPGPVVVAGTAHQQFDLVLWATGAAAQPWLRVSGLAVDDSGFVRVDPALRSVSHPEVFAVGDCAATGEAKSGVHSVRQGITLAQNLRNVVASQPLIDYRARTGALILLTCGARYAIAARGRWSAEGRWAWWWKNAIDRRWLRKLRGS